MIHVPDERRAMVRPMIAEAVAMRVLEQLLRPKPTKPQEQKKP